MSSNDRGFLLIVILPFIFSCLCFVIWFIQVVLFKAFKVHSAILGPAKRCAFRPTPEDFNIVNACASFSDLSLIMGVVFITLSVLDAIILCFVQVFRDISNKSTPEAGNGFAGDLELQAR